MALYIRVGNQTVTQAQLNALTPADIQKINQDTERANSMRQNNLAESMGLKKTNTLNLVPDVRPNSELSKALFEDLKAKNEAAATASAETPQEPATNVKKKRGRPAGKSNKIKTEIIPTPEQS